MSIKSSGDSPAPPRVRKKIPRFDLTWTMKPGDALEAWIIHKVPGDAASQVPLIHLAPRERGAATLSPATRARRGCHS